LAGRFYLDLDIVRARATPEDIDDLDEDLMGNLNLAGLRFDRLLRQGLGTA